MAEKFNLIGKVYELVNKIENDNDWLKINR